VRFELIDQVTEQDETRIAAVKNVSSAEEYLADHFPGFPILPGVMMLEVLVQAARRLAAGRDDRPARPLVVAEARNVKYAAMVKPGQALAVEVTLAGREDDGRWKFVGKGTVAGKTAVQAKFVLREIDGG
jgi:3-hydroxyacyl-[acyl-carrier-protein] dehydratase